MPSRIPVDCEIVVSGTDIFGAKFSEKTRLLELSAQGFSFLLYRPIVDGILMTVNFHPDAPEAGHWVKGIITKVGGRLDGRQTVDVRVSEFPRASSTSGQK